MKRIDDIMFFEKDDKCQNSAEPWAFGILIVVFAFVLLALHFMGCTPTIICS